MYRPQSFLPVFLLALSSLLRAQTPAWSLDGPAFTVSPADMLAAAARVHAEPFAEVTVLFEQEEYTLDSVGSVVHTHRLIYRIENKDGLEDWKEASADWNPWYQGQPTIRARVMQVDGRVSELDPHTLTDVPAKNENDDTYSDARIYKAPLPSLSVGTIVEEQTTVSDRLPFFSGGGIYRVYFSRGVPVIRSRLIVEVPANVPFQIKAHSLPDSTVHTDLSANLRRSVVDVTPVPLGIDSDIDLATDKNDYPMVEFSTGSSWSAVATAYQKLVEPQIQPDRVKSLLPANPPADYLASIQSIVSRLHREIRYTGIEFGESALQPQTPTEILKRHYGDCKDKAAFLVAMLRASGIPANIALLDTGPGIDVNPDLPGINQFDHAIVHVPASAGGKPELWIDATDEYAHVGDLPYADQGRLALIIGDGTTSLTRTPDAKPADSVLIETREVTLKQFGPAQIVETSSTTGQIDADYRERYGATITKATHDDLEQYCQRTYAAKALTNIEHSEGSDLTKPFLLRLKMDTARRGLTSVSDAAVAIAPAAVLSGLPSWFSTDPDADKSKLTPEQEADRQKAAQRRATEYLVRPFITERRYRIVIPEGFVPRALPEDQTVQLGPAILTRHFALEPNAQSPTVVTAVYHFDTVKQRYSTAEVLALRKAVLEADRQDYVVLEFDQIGAKLLADGKIREALAADRGLIAAQPKDAMQHVHMSAAFLGAGLGEQAQNEARLATTLDPKSSIAFFQLAQTLEYNSIGVRLGKGFDLKGAISAYRKAKQLDPDDTSTRASLGILCEYNAEGDRYAEGSALSDAIAEYRQLRDVDKDAAAQYEDNLLYALLYDHQFAAVLTELGTVQSSPTRDAIGITAVAASQTVAAALERADRISGSTQQKSAALQLSGQQLIHLGLYAQAADMLNAGIQGQADAAQIVRQIEIFRNLHHASTDPLPPSDPRGPVQRMLNSMMDGTLGQQVPLFLARHAYATDAEWNQAIDHNDSSGNISQVIAQRAQMPTAVMRDVVLGNAKITCEGDDAHGYRVSLAALGAANQNLFVSRDDGNFKIVADGNDSAEVGNYAMYLLQNNREPEARSLLDWKRDLVHRGGGDDPLEGDLFARFWTTTGDNSGPDAIQIAAIALTIQKPESQVPLAPALTAFKANPANTDLALLLASAYLNHQDGATARTYTDRLLARYPDSITAITLAGRADRLLGDFAAWSTLLNTHLAKRPTDRSLLLQSAYEAEAESDFPRARKALQQIVDSGKATSFDYNNLAWLGLFDDHVDAKSIEAGQQATLLTNNSSFNELHTLACLYAAQGKTSEARQLLLDGMAAANLAEPNSPVWLGFGYIYEQFGADDAAIAAYRKVTKPDSSPIDSTDTWVLAQRRLKSLHAN